jgi:hypothetical protein
MGMQLRDGASNCGSRVASTNNGAAWLVYEIVGNQEAGSPGSGREFSRASMGHERKIFIAGVFKRRNAADFAVSVTLPGRFQQNGQLFDAQTCGLL